MERPQHEQPISEQASPTDPIPLREPDAAPPPKQIAIEQSEAPIDEPGYGHGV